MIPFPQEQARRIVLLRIGKIGDIIVSSFAFRKVRRTFPHARIMLVTLDRNRELLRTYTDADSIRYFRGGLDILPLAFAIRRFKADMLLDFNDNPSTTSAMLTRYSGASIRVGFAFENNTGLLTHPVACPPHEKTHITERIRKIPEALGMSFTEEEIAPLMSIDNEARSLVKLHLASQARHRPLIAVNLSAGSESRYWQSAKWVQLIAHVLASRPECAVVVLSAPADKQLLQSVVSQVPAGRVIVPRTTDFHSFASYIAEAQLLISPDTAAIHIATACGIPAVGLYPAVEWNFVSWAPKGTNYEAVRPRTGLVSEIGVGEVIAAVQHLLARSPTAVP